MAVNKRNLDRRKPELRPLSAAAEVCETRALLSAATVGLPPVDGSATVSDASSEEETIDATEADEFVPEIAVCTMLPVGEELVSLTVVEDGEVVEGEAPPEEAHEETLIRTMVFKEDTEDSGDADGEVLECEVVDLDVEYVDEELANWEPSWSFRTLTGSIDENDGEEVVDADLEVIDDSSGELDPAWIYQSFLPLADDVDSGESFEVDPALVDPPLEYTELEFGTDGEEVVFVSGESSDDVTTMEGYDPSWAYRGEVVDGEVFEGEEVSVEEETDEVEGQEKEEYLVDSESDGELIFEDETVEEVTDPDLVDDETLNPIRTFGGPEFRDVSGGGDLPVEILMSSSGIRGIETTAAKGETSPGVVQGPNAVIVPQAVGPYLTSLPPIPVQSVVPPAIPLLHSQSTLLFEDEQEIDFVGTLISPSDDGVSVSSGLAEESVSSLLESSPGSLVSADTSTESGELDVLAPLLESETETNSDEVIETPDSEEVPADSEEPVTSSTKSGAEAVAAETSGTVPVQTAAIVPRVRSVRAIDSFMTEFSLNGFVG